MIKTSSFFKVTGGGNALKNLPPLSLDNGVLSGNRMPLMLVKPLLPCLIKSPESPATILNSYVYTSSERISEH
ncbi:MAG: hypothetical protein IJ859_09645 [Synergistaceae bacterium]|nr:hypothetical protein [Synergistaceae bacterium]